jgi:hypothetical protein
VSHHPDAGLTDPDLEKIQDHTRPDKVIDFQRLQTWCESVQNLEDPNSLDEHIPEVAGEGNQFADITGAKYIPRLRNDVRVGKVKDSAKNNRVGCISGL